MCREKRKCYISSCIAMSANYVVCMVTPTNAHLKKFKDDTSFSTKKCWKRQFSMILGASARRRVWLGESVIMNVEILIQILLSLRRLFDSVSITPVTIILYYLTLSSSISVKVLLSPCASILTSCLSCCQLSSPPSWLSTDMSKLSKDRLRDLVM